MSTTEQIQNIICENPGTIYSINDFYQYGTKNTVKSILLRLNNENVIDRLIDGLYTKPNYSEILEEYSYPDANQVAEKIAEKFAWSIAPFGDTALNYTGLSTQIPNEYIYISDGPYRSYDYRGKKIIFKHTTNRNITSYSRELSILIQAIRALGEENISDVEINQLRKYAQQVPENLTKDTGKLPFWIQKVLFQIQEE